MVGGGAGTSFGAVHRLAARLDGELELVCGSFSRDAARSLQVGEELHLASERCYASYEDMFRAEESRMPGERMEFVAIVTPNHLHFPIASSALEHGFHVLSDKPATVSLAQARELHRLVQETGLLYGLTYPYTSYPMVTEARQRVANGAIGNVRKVLVEYTQGWLSEPVEHRGNKKAKWRLDPAQAGPSGCMGDIGVHAFNLVETVTGLVVTEVSASLNRTVPGRLLDDDGTALLRFDKGAHGVLIASQVCAGDENNLRIRVYGDAGNIEWSQEEPNSLWLRFEDRPAEAMRAAASTLGMTARKSARLPPGHPEGYLEACANIYRNFAGHIRSFVGTPGGIALTTSVPGIRDALRGMAFIEVTLASHEAGSAWLRFPEVA